MITRVAVVPNPPLLVPELVPGSVADTAGVRDAVLEAAAWLAEESEHWLAIGVHDGPRRAVPPSTRSTFAGYGVDVPVALSDEPGGEVEPDAPLPALVAGWLRGQTGATSVHVELVPPGYPPDECIGLGRRLADAAQRSAVPGPGVLLVLGDGSIRHGERAPARPDERAPAFEARVAAALAKADAAALSSIEPELAADMGAMGRAAWQVAAGVLGDDRWVSKLLYSDTPFGVGYHVATWERP
jgi:hypothetical protein